MRRYITTTIATVMLIANLVSIPATAKEHNGNLTTTGSLAKTVTKSVQVHANVPRIPKFKIIRSNPYRSVSRLLDNDSDDFIDDDGLITPYRRRDLGKIEKPESISEHAQFRLWLARQLAMKKYQEVWG